jgi:hypothetical protein
MALTLDGGGGTWDGPIGDACGSLRDLLAAVHLNGDGDDRIDGDGQDGADQRDRDGRAA